MTSDLGVPAFNAIISDLGETSATTLYAHSGGSGCHPRPAIALQKAIVEAAQSRITRITGSRDDLPAATYRAAEGQDRAAITGMLAFADRAVARQRKPIVVEAAPMLPAESIQSLIERLGRHGIDLIVAAPIANDFGIAVVRVIVPGLQTEITGSSSKLGRRALLKLVGRLQ
jgi:ribosomal protein S12 methylthiotransferase accessory factor